MKQSASFAIGVATVLVVAVLFLVAFIAMVPVGHAASFSFFPVCVLLVIIPSVLSFFGFTLGAYTSNASAHARPYLLGVISGIAALVTVITIFIITGNAVASILLLALLFFCLGGFFGSAR